MTREQLKQVSSLQPFGQSHPGQEGLGMGLALAQKLLLRCGGTLLVESELGVGTTVRASFRTDPPQ
jgi:signal transduction histidine kinase